MCIMYANVCVHLQDCRLNPSASEFMPRGSNDEEVEEEDDDEEEEEEEEGERQCRKGQSFHPSIHQLTFIYWLNWFVYSFIYTLINP